MTITASEFKAQYFDEPQLSELSIEDRLAIRYHLECEYFDRQICRDRDQFGDAQPASQMQRAAINRNAEQVLSRLYKENPACKIIEFRSAIHRYGSGYSTAGLERIAQAIGLFVEPT